VGAEFDLKSPDVARDPYSAFAWLRDHEPVHWSESLGAWVVTRYADALEIWNRPDLFSSDRFRKVRAEFTSQRPDVRAVAAVLSEWLVFRDPPDHTRLRALLQKTFTPRQLANSRPRIQAAIDALIDGALAKGGEYDFVAQFAFPLPALVIALLLGAPSEDIERIKEWSDQLAAYLGGSLDGQDNFTRARAGVEGLTDYFTRLLREKSRNPSDDLIGLMLRAEHDGHTLGSEEIVSNCVLLLFAGHETTTNLLANGLFHLLRDPAAGARLRAQPELTASAVEELLRYESPVPATVKVVTRDLEFRGAALRAGEMVLPFLSAANRDPRQFTDADRLDLARSPNRHLAFGWGIHFCLGAPLARLEASLAFRSLLERVPHLALADAQPRWRPWLFFRALEVLRVRWDGSAPAQRESGQA
jgi:cytochrome P450